MDNSVELDSNDVNSSVSSNFVSSQSSQKNLKLLNDDIELIDQVINNLDTELTTQRNPNTNYEIPIDPTVVEHNHYIYANNNKSSGFKFASGRIVNTDLNKLKKAKELLGIAESTPPRRTHKGPTVHAVTGSKKTPISKFSLDHIKSPDNTTISPDTVLSTRRKGYSISDSSDSECVVSPPNPRFKRMLVLNNVVTTIEDDNRLETRFRKSEPEDSKMIDGDIYESFTNLTRYESQNSTPDSNFDLHCSSFASENSTFSKASTFGFCKLTVPVYSEIRDCSLPTDSEYVRKWLKYSDCKSGKLTIPRLFEYWNGKNANPFAVKFNDVYDFKFIVSTSQNCVHIGGISDIRESFKDLTSCIYSFDLTKWVTHHFKLLAFNECSRFCKGVYNQVKAQNSTLSTAVTKVSLPNPYRIVKRLIKRYETESFGFRSIFKLLFEGDISKFQSFIVKILDVVDDVLYVYDGMYCIPAKAEDDWVKKLIARKYLRPGVKIMIDEFMRGSQYTTITSKSPHLLDADEYISLKYNSIRKVKGYSKIGLCEKIPRNISEMKLGGGNASLLDVVVLSNLSKVYHITRKNGDVLNVTQDELISKFQYGKIGSNDSEVYLQNQYIIIDHSTYSKLNEMSVGENVADKLYNSIAYVSIRNLNEEIDEDLTRKHVRLKLSQINLGSIVSLHYVNHLKHINHSQLDPAYFLRSRCQFPRFSHMSLYLSSRSKIEIVELNTDELFKLPSCYMPIPTCIYTLICEIPVLSLSHYYIQYYTTYLTSLDVDKFFNLDIEPFCARLIPHTIDNYSLEILPGLGFKQYYSILGMALYVTDLDENINMSAKENKTLYLRIFLQTMTNDLISIKIICFTNSAQSRSHREQMMKIKTRVESHMGMYNGDLKARTGGNVGYLVFERVRFTNYDETNKIFQFESELEKVVVSRKAAKHTENEIKILNKLGGALQALFEKKESASSPGKSSSIDKWIKITLNNMIKVGKICCAYTHYLNACVECLAAITKTN